MKILEQRLTGDIQRIRNAIPSIESVFSNVSETEMNSWFDSFDVLTQNVSNRLEHLLEVLCACMPLANNTSASGLSVREMVIRGALCILQSVSVMNEVESYIIQKEVQMSPTVLSNTKVPPPLQLWIKIICTLKRQSLFIGDRLLTLLYCGSDPYIDLGDVFHQTMCQFCQYLLSASTIYAEPLLVLSQTSDETFAIIDELSVATVSRVFSSTATGYQNQIWGDQEIADLQEFRRVLICYIYEPLSHLCI